MLKHANKKEKKLELHQDYDDTENIGHFNVTLHASATRTTTLPPGRGKFSQHLETGPED